MKKYEKEELIQRISEVLYSTYKEIKKSKLNYALFIYTIIVFAIIALGNLKLFVIFVISCILLFFLAIEIFLRKEYKGYFKSEYFKVKKYPLIFTVLTTGNLGEYLTYVKLKEVESSAKFLFNVYLNNSNESTEVDIIMISKYGIYVFESCNISGRIYANENDKFWTIKSKGKTIQKYSPIKQNLFHTNRLIKLFPNFPKSLYEQYVVLSERCSIGKMDIHTNYIHVIKRENLVNEIKENQNNCNEKLSSNEVDMIYNALYKYQFPTKEEQKNHDKYVQKIKSEQGR